MAEILYYENGKPKTAADFQSIPKNLDGFTWGQTPGSVRRIIFLSVHGAYQKGDILWLEPASYETRSTPPKLPTVGGAAYPYTVPAAEAFMGKARTYSEPTDYRQYAVRLRALKDNPRNPNIVGAIGSDWAVDEPSAIVEEGSNANGSYTIAADGKKLLTMVGFWGSLNGGAYAKYTRNFPIHMNNTQYLLLRGEQPDSVGYYRNFYAKFNNKIEQSWQNGTTGTPVSIGYDFTVIGY